MYNNYENEEDDIEKFMLREPAATYGLRYYKEAEYLEMEWAADVKHEYYRGEIFAMSGASNTHNFIFSNVFTILGPHLKGSKCRPFGSDMRVHIPENSLFTYPDISVFCGDIQRSPFDNDTAVGPSVIIEILSPSTRNYDKGPKRRLYQAIPTLREYILIDSEAIGIETYRSAEKGLWEREVYSRLSQSLFISTVQLSLPLEEIYEGTLLHEQV